MRMEVIENGRPVPKELHSTVLLDASVRFRKRQIDVLEQRETNRAKLHAVEPQDHGEFAKLVGSVERRLVDAIWTERCLPNGGSGGICGLAYFHDRTEIFANAVAAGEWHRPHPGTPAPRAIDRMHEPLIWLGWLQRELAELVRAAAATKRGDPEANVAWGQVRRQATGAEGLSVRTLQRRYDLGLRTIALRLALG